MFLIKKNFSTAANKCQHRQKVPLNSFAKVLKLAHTDGIVKHIDNEKEKK
jgi:hypothetical protein